MVIPKILAHGNSDPIIQAAAIIMLAAACEKGKAAAQRKEYNNPCYRADINTCVDCMKKLVFYLAMELAPKRDCSNCALLDYEIQPECYECDEERGYPNWKPEVND